MNQLGAVVQNRIKNFLHVLSKYLYPSIYIVMHDFDVPTQTLQKKINTTGLLSNRLSNNQVLSNAQK